VSKEKSNVIPLIRDSKTRKIVKDQFDRPPATRPGGLLDPMATKQDALKEKLAKINQTMTELKDMVTKQNDYLSETSSDLAPLNQSALDEEKLRAEYERKKDEAKKRRLDNNRKVTREYNLHHPSRGKPGRYDE
jgi:uncharacterized phage infection (PIP) family protein YhgE